jgi:3-oxoacyl-[acyl-carrier protein] reductase
MEEFMVMDSFKGQHVLVTGASSGIGWHAARLFAQAGGKVLAHYHHHAEGAASLASAGEVTSAQADLSLPEGVEALRAAVDAQFAGRVDILVNNAGSLVKRARFFELDEALWDTVMHLNLKSVYLCCRAFLPGMVERRQGCVINVSSIAGRNGGGLGAIAYVTAKGAIISFTKGLAKEFAPFGIRVNAVSPGTVDTNYHRVFSTAAMLEAVCAATPMGRLGRPEEIAEAILFLASPAASFITGETLEVNGGALMD